MNQADDRPPYSGPRSIWSAVLVIAIGVALLLSNFDIGFPWLPLHNAWALFILLGAVPALICAVRRYRAQGRIDGAVFHDLCTAAIVVTVALFFLCDLSWQRWWPVFVIYGGVCMLAPRGRWQRVR
ncbi:LiaF transmembrane domain-containing protein [Dyella sp. A6]|uniref:LiaF transmembrane domain-containing protein n=1 Tax=Dyella aluminiiresistens TaxID=3069105 RepID=UPI002E765168|nr:hypothetical protein [Dyella sp. A6]